MAEHQHLPLPSAEVNLERRKRPGFGGNADRDYRVQGTVVRTLIDTTLNRRRQRPRIAGVDPSLIIRIRTAGYTSEADWEASGLTVLSVDGDRTLILFATDEELTEFRRRVDSYRSGPRQGRINAPYSGMVSAIEDLGEVEPSDRIGRLLKNQGFESTDDFVADETYALDVELWDIRPNALRAERVAQIVSFVAASGGEVPDRYTGRTMTLLRVVASGGVFDDLLRVSDVRQIDLPPQPDMAISQLLDLTAADFPDIPELLANAPSVTVLDSGLAIAHPLIGAAAGECIAVPPELGPDDIYGHGTKVAGIAVYGDVRSCAENRNFRPEIRIHSAKVVTDSGRFPDQMLVTTQMRRAIEHFRTQHGCRVFNLSLGDQRLVFNGQVGPWAAVIDELARELDVVIVVSAGNLTYLGATPEIALSEYPRYLLNDSSRIVEPANAAIALTVGSISHAASVPPEDYYGVAMQPVADVDCPSPFTRCGPGAGGCLKPDLSDYGGNLTFDGVTQSVTDNWDANSILTFNSDYLDRLFTTAVGTSFAAPRVAYKAALLSGAFPDASANMIRTLLGSSAEIPPAARQLLDGIAGDACDKLCGLGIPNLNTAMYSDDHRVFLFADSTIEPDQFRVYEIPIVDEFRGTSGERSIQITLAFDPPVRHTRADYLGNRMSFRLVRGSTLSEVTEHYRRRGQDEGPVPDLPGRKNCSLIPTPSLRDINTLQRGIFKMRQNPADEYGDTYFLVVRCENRWADETPQRFAVAVEIVHRGVTNLYARVAQRVALRTRVRATA